MKTLYFVNSQGEYLGGYSAGNSAIPAGAIEVSSAPEHAEDKFTNEVWAPDFARVSAAFEAAVQSELDADAVAKGYDNILSACSYASSPNPFQNEGKLFVTRRGNAWAYCYAELAKVQNGSRPMPTIEQIIEELPPRVSAL